VIQFPPSEMALGTLERASLTVGRSLPLVVELSLNRGAERVPLAMARLEELPSLDVNS
jgi:hypothetical protein